jgi:DNA-directed RNA polymerase subunit RPC12/RpoP
MAHATHDIHVSKSTRGVNDLMTVNPSLAEEWHPTRNGSLRPDEIAGWSERKVWWLGTCGHEWEATVGSRNNGRGCAYCSGRHTLAGFNDLATVAPGLAAEWHPTKNGDVLASGVSPGSKLKRWWLAACGHEWDASVASRSDGSGCPVCTGKRVLIGFNDLATAKPGFVAEWHPTKNGDLVPHDVTAGSNRNVWWLGACGHEWVAEVGSRSRGTGCPHCSRSSTRRVLAGFNDLATVAPGLAAEWHPTKNGDLTPRDVTVGSSRAAWWIGTCGHEWLMRTSKRTKGHGCPYCSRRRVLAGFNDLATVAPGLAAEWHPIKNGDLTPRDVAGCSNRKTWWLGSCGHEWASTPNNRAHGHGCAVCAGRQVQRGQNDLATVAPELAAEWHPTKNGALTPESVTAGSDRQAWWLGACGHVWRAAVASRSKGSGCASCARRGFDPTTPARLYLLHHPTLRLLKVGVTAAAKDDRIAGFVRLGWSLADEVPFDVGRNAADLEVSLLRHLRSMAPDEGTLAERVESASGSLGGTTEMFDDSITTSRTIRDLSMESVFAGSMGGLVGVDHRATDPDHRAFVLGLLAAV